MPDTFVPGLSGSTTPAAKAAAITPSDSTVVDCRAVYVGGTGDISAILIGDTTAVWFRNAQAGTVLAIQCNKIMAATTATNLVALK